MLPRAKILGALGCLGVVCAAAAALAAGDDRHYEDDADGRHIARVAVETVKVQPAGEPAGVRLRLTVSADGPDVDPVPGFTGVRGANRYTAEQLARLLNGPRRLTLRTTSEGGETGLGGGRPGQFYATRFGRLPERRLRPDGSIDYLAASAEQYPLEVAIESSAVGEGRHDLDLLVDGQARMRVQFDVTADGAEVGGVFSLGPDGKPVDAGAGAGLPLPLAGAAPAPEPAPVPGDLAAKPAEPPPPPPVDAGEWGRRDLEGKWVLYRKTVLQNPATKKAWVPFLAAQKDFEFLEWLCLYEVDGYSSMGAGLALADAQAPQWARAAAWALWNELGYGENPARLILLARQGQALAWLRKHQDGLGADAKGLLEQLEAENVQPIDAPDLLPPLRAEDVLAFMVDPPAELAAFGDQLEAEPGKVYEHQVTRAINGLLASGLAGDPVWADRLMRLTRHPNEAVRRGAFLAYTYLKSGGPPPDELMKVIDDPAEPGPVREAAALALSYHSHPAAYVKLHHLSADPAHPAWKAAVSRLGEIGDGFTLEHWKALDGADLPPESADLLATSRVSIAARVDKEANTLDGPETAKPHTMNKVTRVVTQRLERAAWAELNSDPLAQTLVPWALESLGRPKEKSPRLNEALDRVRDGEWPQREDDGQAWGPIRERVQLYAEQLLTGEQPG